MSRLPLDGIRVVEISHMVMGPTCGMILGDLGAEVIKIEPTRGDGTRRLLGAGAGFFRTFNRNKQCIAIDVNTPQGRDAVLELIDTADVFIENFKPGRMQELGFGYAAIRQRNPRIIYASHKGFLNGPYDNRLALDEVVQMMAGLAYMTGPVGRPLRAGSSVNDIMGGMFGAIGVLAAINDRTVTGVGREVQSALYENCVLLAAQHMQQYAVTGQAAAPMPNRISAWGIRSRCAAQHATAHLFSAKTIVPKLSTQLYFFAVCPSPYAATPRHRSLRASLRHSGFETAQQIFLIGLYVAFKHHQQ